MHGIDFGGYTEWKRPLYSPKPIEFVICGVAWGKNKNTTYDINLPEIRKEKRLMTYGFYNGTHEWLAQAEAWLRLSRDAGSKAIWMDWERSSTSVLDDNPQGHALRAKSIINFLQNEFDGKIGIYSNFNDYVVYLQPHVVEARDWPWWVAWPDESFDTPPGNTTWWGNINRERNDYIVDQYSWKGYGPDYGATNDKKSMDLNVVNPAINLDVWLGIEEEPGYTTPEMEYTRGWNDAIDRIQSDAEEARRKSPT